MSSAKREEAQSQHKPHRSSDSSKTGLEELVKALTALRKTAEKSTLSITPTLKSTLATTLEFLHCQAEADWHLAAYKQAENQSHQYLRELEMIRALSDEIGQLCENYSHTEEMSEQSDSSVRDTKVGISKIFEHMKDFMKSQVDDEALDLGRSDQFKEDLQKQSEHETATQERNVNTLSLDDMHIPNPMHLSGVNISEEEGDLYKPELRSDKPINEQDKTFTEDLPIDNNVTVLRTNRAQDMMPENIETIPHAGEIKLVFKCLGEFKASHNGVLIEDWNGHKGILILKYLLTHPGKPVSKEKLMSVMWPFSDQESARRNLHQAIYSLRQTFRNIDPDHQYIIFKNEKYMLNPDIETWVDFVEFEELLRQGNRLWKENLKDHAIDKLSKAIDLYGGVFMEEELYEEWTDINRERLEHLYIETLNTLANHFLDEQEYSKVIEYCQKILAHDDCNESAYRKLMRSYLEQDLRHMAMRQYQACEQALKNRFGLPPSDKTQEYYKQIIQAA